MATRVKKVAPKPLLEFCPGLRPEGQADASIPLRWKISPELVEQIKQQGFKDPQMLVSVGSSTQSAYGGGEIYRRETVRYVVPLKAEMLFVSFSRPGVNEIVATIIDARSGGSIGKILHRRNGNYGEDIFDYRGAFYSDIAGMPSLKIKEVIKPKTRKMPEDFVMKPVCFMLNVDVPEEMFAPEPPKWLNNVVENFWRGKSFDQCDFRKRAIITLAWLPFHMILGYVCKLLSLIIVVVAGLRLDKEAWQSLRPIEGSWFGLIKDSKGTSFWFQPKNVHRYDYDGPWHLPVWRMYLSLPVIFGPAALAYVIMQLPVEAEGQPYTPLLGWSWWHTFLVTNAVVIGLAIVSVAIAFIIGAVIGVFGPRFGEASKRRKARRQSQAELSMQELEAMARMHDGDCLASIDALPEDKQTVSLKFYRLKARVCRPYASR